MYYLMNKNEKIEKTAFEGGLPDSGDEKDADWTAGVCV